jgi:hypothetical protein
MNSIVFTRVAALRRLAVAASPSLFLLLLPAEAI